MLHFSNPIEFKGKFLTFILYSICFTILNVAIYNNLCAQKGEIPVVKALDIKMLPKYTITKLWHEVGTDPFGRPVLVPVMVLKGDGLGPVIGLTAAIHGNELNGIPVIQKVISNIDPKSLKGTIIGIPGINPESILMNDRRFTDGEDLNRIFPGKVNGSESEQRVYTILNKLISLMDINIDMHTASFGRENCYYARADMKDDTLAKLAVLQYADIIVDNVGQPSFGSGSGQTSRAAAVEKGVKTITVEYGNPQVYQDDMIKRGIIGVTNALKWLKMIPGRIESSKDAVICATSSWQYTDTGGYLEVEVELTQKLTKGQKIATLRNPFGEIVKEYYSPTDGIVIGKSNNPVATQGARIIHIGKY
jgi:predicted deacylase